MKSTRYNNFHLTCGDIADVTGVGRATVQRWITRGELKVDYHMPSAVPRAMVHIKDLRKFFREKKMPTFETFLKLRKVTITLREVKAERAKPVKLRLGRHPTKRKKK